MAGPSALNNITGDFAISSVYLTSLTIYQNHATTAGGGLWIGPYTDAPYVDNCIIAGNQVLDNPNGNDVSGTVDSSGFNLIGLKDGSDGWGRTDQFGLYPTPLDPGLDPAGLQNNGGPTQTIKLLNTSAGYQTGNPSLAGNANPLLAVDQRGMIRQQNPAAVPPLEVSIGAYDPNAAAAVPAGAVIWVGLGDDNDWNTAANWSTDTVPGSDDIAYIPTGYSVTISSGSESIDSIDSDGSLSISGGSLSVADPSTINTLTLSGGTLTGTGDLTVTNSFTWTSGTLAGTGQFTIETSATADLSGATTLITSGESVTNNGTVTLDTSTTLELDYSATFVNNGTFNLYDGSALTSATSDGSFDNEGTFTIASSATATVGVAFINDSNISGYGSSLTFQSADFTMLDGSSVQGATFDNEALYLAYGDSATTTDSTFTDTTIDGGGTLNLSGTTLSGTNTWSSGLNVTDALNLSSGTLTLNDNITIGTLNLSGGTLTGTGDITVSDAFNWTGGSLAGTGQFTIGTSASADLSASSTLVLDGVALVNNGSVTVESDTTLELDDAATVVNNYDFSVSSGAALTSATSDGTFDNEGTLSGDGTVGVAVTNDGYAADLTFTNDVTLLDGSSVATVSFEYNTLYLSSGATATLPIRTLKSRRSAAAGRWN